VSAQAEADVALVTGAAGSIGLATIRALAGRDLRVVTADQQPLHSAEAALVALALDVNLVDDEACAAAFARLPDLGSLRHVVAVAGGGDVEELSQPDPPTEPAAVFARVVANNLGIAFTTVRHAVPLLRRTNGDRSITLVGSINAYGGYGAPGYSAAKAGLSGLVNALTTPLGAEGIRINCLALGTVDTENLHALAAARSEPLDLAETAAAAPLKRVLAPRDVASALVAMALDMPGLTGETIVLDNGQTHIR
jgi:NAD(P)-dependent dehydrogenase (short-subunit alcohol dehydrogenase family)